MYSALYRNHVTIRSNKKIKLFPIFQSQATEVHLEVLVCWRGFHRGMQQVSHSSGPVHVSVGYRSPGRFKIRFFVNIRNHSNLEFAEVGILSESIKKFKASKYNKIFMKR